VSAETGQPGEPEVTTPAGEEHPRGTLLVVGVFFVALVVLWTLMYLMMLSRS
jgi:hypothetical protein